MGSLITRGIVGLIVLGLGTVRAAEIEYLAGHTKAIREIRVSPDGRTLATVAGDGQILLRPLDDLTRSKGLKVTGNSLLKEFAFQTACFTRDSRHLLTTGGLEDLEASKDYFAKFDLVDGSEERIPYELRGGLTDLHLSEDETQATFLAGKLLVWSFKEQRYVHSTEIEAKHSTGAVSPTERLYAFPVYSQIDIAAGNVLVAPDCRLVIRKPSGQRVFEAELPFLDKSSVATLHFASDERLLSCRGPGEILVWTRTRGAGEWTSRPVSIPPDPGRITALCMGPTDEGCWIARDENLLAIDLRTGKITAKHAVKAGGVKEGVYYPGIITTLAALRPSNRLVAGLQNGQLAVVPLGPAP